MILDIVVRWTRSIVFDSFVKLLSANNADWSSFKHSLVLISSRTRWLSTQKPFLLIPSDLIPNRCGGRSVKNRSTLRSVTSWPWRLWSHIKLFHWFWVSALSWKCQLRNYPWSFKILTRINRVIISWTWATQKIFRSASFSADGSDCSCKYNFDGCSISNLFVLGVILLRPWSCSHLFVVILSFLCIPNGDSCSILFPAVASSNWKSFVAIVDIWSWTFFISSSAELSFFISKANWGAFLQELRVLNTVMSGWHKITARRLISTWLKLNSNCLSRSS